MSKENSSNPSRTLPVLSYIILSLSLFIVILAIPASREVFKTLSGEHPYLMGFGKFALLATAGELIAARMASGKFQVPKYVIARFVIWGVIGVWITYMMKIFGGGVGTLMAGGFLPNPGNEIWNRILRAFFISLTMNVCFGPTFMAVHKCSDTYLSMRAEGVADRSVSAVIKTVDWSRFVSFTLFQTVPLFWIPAHTVTFLLPVEYQVMMAAFLSVALGIILNLKKKKA